MMIAPKSCGEADVHLAELQKFGLLGWLRFPGP